MTSKFYSEMANECADLCNYHADIIDKYVKNPEMPILMYCYYNNINPNSVTLNNQINIFNECLTAEENEALFWKDTAQKLENEAFKKYTLERGLKNIPKNR